MEFGKSAGTSAAAHVYLSFGRKTANPFGPSAIAEESIFEDCLNNSAGSAVHLCGRRSDSVGPDFRAKWFCDRHRVELCSSATR
ncbi:MAG: hypothetical protein Fues2KO_16080 [Fuerstiella sp.]